MSEGWSSILLATDFGTAASRALSDAALLARTFSAEVKVIHVLAAHEPSSPSIETALERALQALREAGARAEEGTIARGSAAETILQRADARSDVIVIGGGDGSRARFTTGPTAETVARFAHQPVWISHTEQHAHIGRVLCAVDPSPASREALGLAFELSRRFGATLEPVHVWEGPHGREHRLAQLGELLTHAGIDGATLRLVEGRPSDELRKVVVETRADLLVMGRVGTTGLRRVFLGGTAERLLRALPCALLLTSPKAP